MVQSLIINEALWSICGALVRVSGCCLLRVVLAVLEPSKRLRGAATGLLCLCIFHGLASVLEICLICRPIARQWDAQVEGLCGDQITSFIALESIGLALDVAILLAPLKPMLQIELNKKKTWGMMALFEAGAV